MPEGPQAGADGSRHPASHRNRRQCSRSHSLRWPHTENTFMPPSSNHPQPGRKVLSLIPFHRRRNQGSERAGSSPGSAQHVCQRGAGTLRLLVERVHLAETQVLGQRLCFEVGTPVAGSKGFGETAHFHNGSIVNTDVTLHHISGLLGTPHPALMSGSAQHTLLARARVTTCLSRPWRPCHWGARVATSNKWPPAPQALGTPNLKRGRSLALSLLIRVRSTRTFLQDLWGHQEALA